MMNLTNGSAYVVMVGNSYQSPVAVFAEKHGAEKLAEQIDQHVTVKVVESTDKEVWLVLPHKHSSIKFLSPYVAVCEDPEAQTGDSKNCQNPAAGCAI